MSNYVLSFLFYFIVVQLICLFDRTHRVNLLYLKEVLTASVTTRKKIIRTLIIINMSAKKEFSYYIENVTIEIV